MHKQFGQLIVLMSLTVSASATFAQTNTQGGCAIAGPENAPVTIEEYADFECKYCVRGANTLEQVLKNYPGQIRVIFRNLPVGSHTNALPAAKAMSAICLQSQSLASEFQKRLFTHQARFKRVGEPYLYELANQIGVNVDQMKADMNGPVVAKLLADDLAAAASHDFKGTPSFMIGSEAVTGARPYNEMKEIIDRQLAK